MKRSRVLKRGIFFGVACFCVAALALFWAVDFSSFFTVSYDRANAEAEMGAVATSTARRVPKLDVAAYDAKMLALAHRSATSTIVATSTATSSPAKKYLWPPKTAYPNAGALLPFNRIVAYYGNFYSKGMGVLGEYPQDVVIEKLKAAVAEWEAADPSTPVIPAIDYIAVTAQLSPVDGTYRARMPDSQIDIALDLAEKVNGIVILELQVGLSTVQKEIPQLEKYFKLPNVHVALDPEFSMKDGTRPGKAIGTMNAEDINFAAQYLAKLVRDNNLPPKIILIHRFTEDMLTGYTEIEPLPEAQIVVVMDGWGFGAKKINTYNTVIYPEPIQFTGFKLFYKNDLFPPSTRLLTPKEIIDLTPSPSFIQYQ